MVAVEFCDLKYSTNTMAFTLMPGLMEVGFLVDCEGVYMFCICYFITFQSLVQ